MLGKGKKTEIREQRNFRGWQTGILVQEARAKKQGFPRFQKDEKFRSFKKKVEYWNSGSRLTGKQKVLKFVEAFEERSKEERVFISNKIMMNKKIDTNGDDVIQICLKIYEEFYGKTEM